jgi:hypothetical protein
MSQNVTPSAIISAGPKPCNSSGVIGSLLEGAEVGDAGRIVDDEQRMLMSRFPTPFTSVYRCSKNTLKTAISATSRDVRRTFQAGRLARQGFAASGDRKRPVLGRATPEPSGYRCIETATPIGRSLYTILDPKRCNKVETAVILPHKSTGLTAQAVERRTQGEKHRQALLNEHHHRAGLHTLQ